jgi:hypothetical protein
MKTDAQRMADTFQPMQAWVVHQLCGSVLGKLWGLSMCSPTPETISQVFAVFGEPEPALACALQSPTYRRRYRNMMKSDMMPGLKAEAKEPKWQLLRSLLVDIIDVLHERGYQPDYGRIPKVSAMQAEYSQRTGELINEMNSDPEALSRLFSPDGTLGYERARNVLHILDGNDNYYRHLISLIYEIRRSAHDMRMSKRHIGYLAGQLTKLLPPEIRAGIDEVKRLCEEEGESWVSVLAEDGARRNRLVSQSITAIEVLDTEGHKLLPLMRVIIRYLFLATIPSVPGDKESSDKRLPLDDQMAEQIADGEIHDGAWHYTSQGRKPIYRLPAHGEPSDEQDRLLRFAELAGININDLTAKEQQRLSELMTADDMGYQLASKKGVSLAAFYGNRADSEKTQRYRLFKKIKRLANRD